MNTFGYTDLSVLECVCSCVVFHRIKHLKYCARSGAEGDVWSEDRRSSRGMNKIAQ